MSTPDTSGLVITLAGLHDLVGKHVGYTEWQTMDQERVNQFADATDDHQYIHVDEEKAKQSPVGRTIAHGFLTLSLVAPITEQLITVSDAVTGVNCGLNRVRFPAPLPVGEQWRGGTVVLAVSDLPGGIQMRLRVTVEVKGSQKPAMVAESILRLYS